LTILSNSAFYGPRLRPYICVFSGLVIFLAISGN